VHPDDCLELVTFNQEDIVETSLLPRKQRCWPYSYPLTLPEDLRNQDNQISLTIRNTGGAYGLAVIPIYSQQAVTVLALGIWLLISPAAMACLKPRHAVTAWCVKTAPGVLPLFGLILLLLTQLNATGKMMPWELTTTFLLTSTVSLLLLLNILDNHADGSIRRKPSLIWMMISAGCFLHAANHLFVPAPVSQVVTLLGALAGIWSVVDNRQFCARTKKNGTAVAIAVTAMLSPLIYGYWNYELWRELATATAAVIRGGFALLQMPVNSYVMEASETQELLRLHFVQMVSPDFSLRVASPCSGFEGMCFILFLLSVFLLLDWQTLFSRVRHIWLVFVIAIPYVWLLNIVRIMLIFCYGAFLSRTQGRSIAATEAVDLFHSHVGWIIYLIGFVMFLPLVYRWAKIKQEPKPDCESASR